MAFTYRQPARSTDPEVALPNAAALIVGARSYLVDDAVAGERPPHSGRIARYAWVDHYAHLKTGLKAMAALLKANGWRGSGPRRRQRHRRSRRGAPRRHRVVGKERQPPHPRPRELVRARVRGHRCAGAAHLEPGGGPVWVVPPVPRRVSDRRDHRARRGRCAALSLLAAPGRGDVPDRASGRARRSDLRVRRVPGGVPTQPAGTGDGPGRRRGALGRPRDPARSRRRRGARAWRTAGTSRAATSGTCGATHWWCWATSETAAIPWSRGLLDAYLRHDDPLLRSHAVWAARRLGREDLLPPIEQETDPAVLAERSAAIR